MLRWWIVASNAKGQTALMTRGEIDAGFGNRPAILSISEDGKFLSGKTGPRLIVPGDATPAARSPTSTRSPSAARPHSSPRSAATTIGKVTSPPPVGSVMINGDVDNPVTLTTAQLQQLGSRSMNVNFLNGANPVTAAEQGPLLEDVIRLAKPKIRNTCPNDALRFYIQASATDGYSSLLSWGDISPSYGNRVPLLSINENGDGAHNRAARTLARRRPRRPLRLGNPDPHRDQGQAAGLRAQGLLADETDTRTPRGDRPHARALLGVAILRRPRPTSPSGKHPFRSTPLRLCSSTPLLPRAAR